MSFPAAQPARTEARRLFALAWPVVLTSLNWTILHVTDIIVVGLTGTQEAAALGASRAVTFISIVMAVGWLSGILVHAAQADGAGDRAATGRTLRHGLVAALGLAAIVTALLALFAAPILTVIGVDPHILPAAARVVQVMALAAPFQLVILACSFFFEGISRPRIAMVINLAILPLNALLAWALSGGHLGLPMLGAVGAAAATATASAVGAGAMLIAAWRMPDSAERGLAGSRWTIQWRDVAALLRFGFVPALASALELAGFSILIALSTRLGDQVAHGFQIVFSAHNVTFSFAIGLGSAAGVRVGNAVGEGTAAAAIPRTLIAVGLAAAVTALLALPMILAPGSVAALFPAEAETRTVAAAMLMLWAPFILFDGIQVVLVYALRSLGDQVAAGINSILAYFVITGGLGWAFYAAGWGGTGLALASGLGMVAAAALNGARFWVVARRLAVRSGR
ncbi:MATE family efflux transporter [Sphingomonas sp. FW199]|uniref:MATE family efflux transporter n=1 Tax=Sphingomonas sp. FW199 TaxID=3400217 RepID=UPI003CFA632B